MRGSTDTAIVTGDFLSNQGRLALGPSTAVTIPTRNWHKCYCVKVVANFFNVGADFLNDFLESLPAEGWLFRIHFIRTQCVSQQGMPTGLP